MPNVLCTGGSPHHAGTRTHSASSVAAIACRCAGQDVLQDQNRRAQKEQRLDLSAQRLPTPGSPAPDRTVIDAVHRRG